MKPIQMRRRYQLDEVSVAGLVFRQKREVISRIASRSRPVFVRSRRDVRFASDNRFHAGALSFLIKLDRAMQIAVIGNRNGGHSGFGCLFHQLLHPDRSIQQRVLGVQMQMNERVAGHFCFAV